MAFDIGSVIAKVDADISGFKDGMAKAKTEASGLGSHLKTIGNGLADFGKQAAVFSTIATAAVVAFGKASFDAYAEAEAAQKQLEHAVIGVTKATDAQLKSTMALADELERKGVLDGDNIKTGLAQLSTFGLSNNAVQGLGKSLADLAVNQFGVNASGEQLSQTANMIAKALNGQFGVLEKSGIRFTDAQQAIIKTGTEMEKVKAINEGFAQNLKYTNDVALTTLEGKLAAVRVKFGNLQEGIGQVVAGFAEMVLTDDAGTFATGLETLGIKSDAAVTFFGKLAGAMRDLGNWIAENKELVITFLTGLAIGLGALMVIGTITAMIMAFTNPLFLVVAAITLLYTAFQTNFLGIHDIVMTVIGFIQNLIISVLIPVFQMFSDWFTNVLAPAIVAVWQGFIMPLFQAFVGWFQERWTYIKDMLDGIWKIIKGVIQVAWALVSDIITAGLQVLSGNWAGAWETIKNKASQVWDGLKSIFNGAVEFLKGWGGMIIHNLVAPFEEAWGKIQDLVNKIKDALDFTKRHSPSVMDILNSSINKVNSALGGLEFGANINAHAAGVAVSNGGAMSNITNVRIDMSGAMIADKFGAQMLAEQMGDAIIKRLQQNVRV